MFFLLKNVWHVVRDVCCIEAGSLPMKPLLRATGVFLGGVYGKAQGIHQHPVWQLPRAGETLLLITHLTASQSRGTSPT